MKSMRSRREFLLSLATLSLGLAACQAPSPSSSSVQSPANTPVLLYGAGATFPSFLYLRWFKDYNQQHPMVQISYQPVGSAAGIQQFITGTVDFGASDVSLTDAEIAKVSRGAVLIPTTAGSVAVVYNLSGVKTGLKLSREVLPEIFLGKITRWNDPKLVELNPGVTLPDKPITVVHRSDGSGTTATFTAHLSAISPEWKEKVGTGLNVRWVTGVGIKDNAGIAAQIQQADGVIGYVEYAFAKQLKLSTAALQNKAGKYVQPDEESAAVALATVTLGDDLRGTVADPDGEKSYAIVTYSWLLAYKQYSDSRKAEALKAVVEWGLTEGQKFATELGYVPLPADVAQRAKAALQQIG
ncbi:MAG: phosphate ABC transporter substrate-binding protein PstS [Cyanobacteria bacterium]|nr:phosphate ABC transporter substrate-binding protein PstS [Cyanobacteriota bacterium]MDW8200006.1 phosphate ABC transporter substrate-binding protein PstS [Cyanobacteriota bacterium SKYGB_h_bin112]